MYSSAHATYIPGTLPPGEIDWEDLIPLIGPANAGLARYDGILQGIVNPEILLSPLMTQEAVLSSRIEGTEASLDEVLEFEAGRQLEITQDAEDKQIQDFREILNYRAAAGYATDYLKQDPITLKLIKKRHYRLLDSVRGRTKARGEFRTTQNHIGAPGSDIKDATFVPPSPIHLTESLNSFERYIHAEERDRLVQLGIIHAQFEMIHPFLDGNGRVGRMLVPLFLFEKRLLSSPMFYLSAYLEEHRDIYYNKLQRVSQDGDWTGWIRFFLEAITQQALDNAKKAQSILALYEEMKSKISESAQSPYSIRALDAIFAQPIFETSKFVSRSGIPKQASFRILRNLRNKGILYIIRKSSGRRPPILAFTRLLVIAGD